MMEIDTARIYQIGYEAGQRDANDALQLNGFMLALVIGAMLGAGIAIAALSAWGK